jgi:hypothetical protein
MVVAGFKKDSVPFMRLLSFTRSCQFPRHCERLKAARQSMMGVASGRSDFGQLIKVPRCFFLDCFPLRCARGRNDGGIYRGRLRTPFI